MTMQRGHTIFGAIKAARAWREQRPEHAGEGFVMVWDGSADGWCRELPQPSHWRPFALAVSVRGEVYEARGGNDQGGASRWDALT